MNPWDELEREADAWADIGRQIELWWRDDDAVSDSPALQLLLDRPVSIALAVIPAGMQDSLASRLAGNERVWVLQHGIEHRNLAPPGAKKSEFPPSRPTEESIRGLRDGRQRLLDAFPGIFRSVLVPPWNRIHAALVTSLGEVPIVGLSAYRARESRNPATGVTQVNTHVDVIDWRGARGFVGTPAAIGLIVEHLRQKRLGSADSDEPTGLLTHHLVHDTQTWRFLDEFQSWSDRRREIVWRTADRLFPLTWNA